MTREQAYQHVLVLLSEACREDEGFNLAGIGPEELLTDEERAAGTEPPLVGVAALEAGVRDALAEIERVRQHAHQWNEDSICSVCGADGAA